MEESFGVAYFVYTMTLNYSPHPFFPSVSASSGSLPWSPFLDKGLEREPCRPQDCFYCWTAERGGAGVAGIGAGFFHDPPPLLPPPTPPPSPSTAMYEDVADLLPADPFGMGMTADTTTWTVAIAGWIEELTTNMADHVGSHEFGDVQRNDNDNCDYYNCNRAVSAPAAWLCPVQGCELGARPGSSDAWVLRRQPLVNSYCGEDHDVEMEVLKFGREEEEPSVDCGSGKCCSGGWGDVHGGTGAPHDGLTFALAYLDIPDLLSMERVCKTLQYAVREDPLLWRCIHIGPPLNNKFTDDSLLQLTRRAKGSLECLSLTECSQITDSGLSRVLKDNLKLRKVGCRLAISYFVWRLCSLSFLFFFFCVVRSFDLSIF